MIYRLSSAILLLFLTATTPLLSQEHLEVRFLDVGQGDAVLVRHQGQVLLYDAGPTGSGVATRLRRLGVDTVHVLVASHPHEDHIGGMAAVVDSFPVLNYEDAGLLHTTQAFARLMEALISIPNGVSTIPRDSLGDAELRWLRPPRDSTHWDMNDRSLGLLIRLGAGSVTMAGDAEEAAWDRWLADGTLKEVGEVSLHKSSHHLSRNGDTAEALAVLSPEIVVGSLAVDNRYGHPHEEALDLHTSDTTLLRTDQDGEVVVEVHRDGSWRAWREVKNP